MRSCVAAALVLALVEILGLAMSASAQTPMRWLAHNMQRPRPAVVTPGPLKLPVAPPSDAIVLFDGQDLSKWRGAEGATAKWRVRDGYMESVPDSGYLYSADKFGDVQLHLEWATPVPASGSGQGRGNSGVFLMGLYEVQVLDSYENDTYPDGQAAAVYGQYPPLVNACLPPGEWQSYDIVFRRPRFADDGNVTKPARITVIQNGILVQDDVEVWGPTSWLHHFPYTQHADALPLSLQDHGNPIRYRNIWLRELPERSEPGGLAERQLDAASISDEQLQKLVGDYGSVLGEFGQIELDERTLRLHMDTGQLIDLIPRSATEFVMQFTDGKLDFKTNDAGKVTGFTMHLGGSQYPIQRLEQGN